jgi:hypothetical protein
MDETGQSLLRQETALDPEQGGRREIGLLDHTRLAQREIADGRELVEIEVARVQERQFVLCAVQFLVLQFQLDLMHAQFMDQPLGRLGCQGGDGFIPQGSQTFLGTFTQSRIQCGGPFARVGSIIRLLAHVAPL